MDMIDIMINKLYIIPGIVIGLTFHEFAHAKAASMLGDKTAENMGRVTLNPSSHLDPIGIIMLLVAGFGWGKPVPVNSYNFKNRKRDEIIVSAAGVTLNFFLALFFAIILNLIVMFYPQMVLSSIGGIVFKMIQQAMFINIVLMIFNLLPIPPLDGFNIVAELTNLRSKPIYHEIYSKGPIILIVLIIFNITSMILTPGINAVMNFINFILGFIF